HHIAEHAGARRWRNVIHQVPEEEDDDRNRDERAAVDPPVAILRSGFRTLPVTGEAPTVEVEEQPRTGHPDGCQAESRPPADANGKQRAEELRNQRAKVDPHVEDGEAGVAASVPLLVQGSDDGRDVRLEEAIADGDERQAQQQDEDKDRRTLAIGLELIGGELANLLPAIIDERDRFVLVALDQEPLTAARDVPVLGVARALDTDLVTLTVERCEGLRALATEAQRQVAQRHQDRTELHRALRPEILVGDE